MDLRRLRDHWAQSTVPASQSALPAAVPSLEALQARFSVSDEEARQRFEDTRSDDPFPNIAPSLLNTADLLDYIEATGMISPFEIQAPLNRHLKPASCAIPFCGTVIHWQTDPDHPERSTRVERNLKRGEQLELPRNSIVFVTLEPYFRFPDYIAGRYNLAITQIYRGLLVGTGPLVDPGFQGRLSVPVHNLTGQDYTITGGATLVWMEFTKLSAHTRWAPDARSSSSPYVPFPQRKIDRRTLGDYLAAASANPVISSIPQEIGSARHAAQSAERIVRITQRVALAGALALVIALVALAVEVVSTVRDDVNGRSSLQQRVQHLEQTVQTDGRRLNRITTRSTQGPDGGAP